MKATRLRILPLLLMILLGLLQYHLWFDAHGVVRMVRFKKQLAVEQAVNEGMKQRNETLRAEVDQLRHKNDAIESEAREGLGMIRRGEVFYHKTGALEKNENITQ